jgi:hypothetical protein
VDGLALAGFELFELAPTIGHLLVGKHPDGKKVALVSILGYVRIA